MKQQFGYFQSIPGPVYVLAVIIIFFSALSPAFRTVGNMLNIAQQSAVVAIIAMGTSMVIITGGTDLSLGAVLSLSAMVTALAFRQGMMPFVASVLGILCGLACGAITGAVISTWRVPPFVATLGMMSMAQGIGLGMADGATIAGLPSSFRTLANGSIVGVPLPVILALGCLVIVNHLMTRERFGKYLYAVGGNEEAAVSSGINVRRIITLTYSLAGVLAGFAGVLMASRLNCGHPTVGIGYEFEAIASVVVGGNPLEGGWGNVGRTMLGVLIIGVLKNGLTLLGYPVYWQMAIIGAVLVASIVIANIVSGKGTRFSI